MLLKLKEKRKEQGKTQEWLARKIGVKRSVISKYESGSISPSINTLTAIAGALHLSINDLLEVVR